MDFAEISQHRFRSQPHDTTVSRVIPTGRLGGDLDLIHGDADAAKHRQGIGLGVERVHGPRRLGPISLSGGAGADSRRRHVLFFRHVAGILGTDLEQLGVGCPPCGIAAGGGNEIGQ